MRGELGFGSDNREHIDNNTYETYIFGVHLSFKISKQIAPVSNDIFGWKTLVINLTCGALNG